MVAISLFVSMFFVNARSCEESFAQFDGIKDPLGIFFDFSHPFVTLQTRVRPKHFLQKLVLPHCVNSVGGCNLLNFFFGVRNWVFSKCLCTREYVRCDEQTQRFKGGFEVFVAGRDHRVFVKTPFLQQTEEDVRFVEWLAGSVHKRKEHQGREVDLCRLSLFFWLKCVRKKYFAQHTCGVLQGCPSLGSQFGSKGSERDKSLLATSLVGVLNRGG